MDIATGLSTIAHALGIVKELREIDKGLDSAALKARMADLYATLADVKIALSDAREVIHDRDKKIRELEEQVKTLTSGEGCPICNEGRLKVTASHPHRIFGRVGVQERTLKCDKCGHSENHLYDPTGVTKHK